MNSGLSFVTLVILGTVQFMCISTEVIRICKYEYCYYYRRWLCSPLYCNDHIDCAEGTAINIKYAHYDYGYTRYTKDCGTVCRHYLPFSQTNSIRNFCNGKRTCALNQWNTNEYWTLDISYDCTELSTISKPLKLTTEQTYKTTTWKSSTKDIKTSISQTSTVKTAITDDTMAVSTTSISTTNQNQRVTTSRNYSEIFANSKAEDNLSTDKFPLATVATSITAGVFVLVIALIGIVCFKKRKANKGNTNRTCVQCNDRTNDIAAVANRAYDAANTLDHTTESDEHYEQQHDYAPADIALNTSNANEYNTLNIIVNHEPRGRYGQEYDHTAAHTATRTTNENVYNTLNETSKPLKADPLYDHIPQQSSSTNTAITKLNDDVYNNLNETVQHLNDDSNYDHVSKQSAPMDDIDTYSHVTDARSEVHGADTYSHLNQ